MPIYEYRAQIKDDNTGCPYCREAFEVIQKFNEPSLEKCPKCNGPVRKIISMVSVSYSMDYKAKGTGLHKLVRRDKGTYEKEY